MTDIFHEVDEEVRREKLQKLWERYGTYFIALCVLVVAAIAAWRAYDWWLAKQAAEAGTRFEQALTLSEQGKHAEAEQAFAKVAADAPKGYRVLARFRAAAAPWAAAAGRITQLHGDSATFDWSPYAGRAGLVFVDGSHAYDYVRKDSETALRLAAPGGLVLWHDYGRWEGVSRALDELEAQRRLGLRQIAGTSLVIWRG